MPDPEFLLLGDALWLDFINTAPGAPEAADALTDPAAWLRWTKAVRLEPPERAQDFEEARRFREQLAALALALAEDRSPPPSAVETVNRRLAVLSGREQLLRIAGAWQVRFAPARPPAALEAVAQSVAATLADPLVAVRRCANPECGLFFADATPHHSRRWCSPGRCGERGRVERRRTTRLTPLVPEG